MVGELVYDLAGAAARSTGRQAEVGPEDRLQWARDLDYDEDRSLARTASAPRVMATLRTSPAPSCGWPATPASPPPSAGTPADQTGHYERSRTAK